MAEEGTPPRAPKTVAVDLGPRSYDIRIGRGIVATAGREIAARAPGARVAIVADETVARLHLARLKESLAEARIEGTDIVVAPGEASKSFATLERVVDAILAARLERGDLIVAFGGGVVGDLAGFAAAITRRGMGVVQVPTTLLAQVDSSVGGKTGIDTPHGKNLVGAFHQPQLVIADTALLDSLTPRLFNAGYAELVKIGLIRDAAFFAWLEENWRAIAAGWPERDEAIATAVKAKAETVAADEHDTGVRALLNLGHTFGHALEGATGYSDRLLHGEGVAIGTVLAHKFSARANLAPAADTERVLRHFRDVGLPTSIADIPGEKLEPEALMELIAQDKKVARGKLTFILTRGIGKAFIAPDVAPADVLAFLREQVGS